MGQMVFRSPNQIKILFPPAVHFIQGNSFDSARGYF